MCHKYCQISSPLATEEEERDPWIIYCCSQVREFQTLTPPTHDRHWVGSHTQLQTSNMLHSRLKHSESTSTLSYCSNSSGGGCVSTSQEEVCLVLVCVDGKWCFGGRKRLAKGFPNKTNTKVGAWTQICTTVHSRGTAFQSIMEGRGQPNEMNMVQSQLTVCGVWGHS